MAVRVQTHEENPVAVLGNTRISHRCKSGAETKQTYHEDVAPPVPPKDEKFRKLFSQRSLVDTLGLATTNNMYSSLKPSQCEHKINPYRRDSVLDFEFGCSSGSKVEDSGSYFTFDNQSTEVLLESYYPSETSQPTTSPRQSLLPPLPPHLLSLSSQAHLPDQSAYPPPQRPLPATPFAKPPVPKPDCEFRSKRSISPLELEQLRQIALPTHLSHQRTPSPPSAVTSTCTLLNRGSSSSTSTSTSSSDLNSPMSSYSNADTVSPPTTAGSTLSAVTTNGSTMHERIRSRKPPYITPPESLTSTVHGRSISLPMKTKSTSPFCDQFDLGLPSHNFETRRQSPNPPMTETSFSMPLPDSPYTFSLGTPTTPSSNAPLIPPSQERPEEISAWDSDSDDEGRSKQGTLLRKVRSRPFLAASRNRAETVPTTNARNFTKGANLPKRVPKQDIRIPDPHLSNISESTGTGCGIAVARTSDSSTTSPIASRISGLTASPPTLRKKVSNMEESSFKSKRTSKASKSSKKSGTSTRGSIGSDGGIGERGKRKRTSEKRFRSWIARLFRRRNMV